MRITIQYELKSPIDLRGKTLFSQQQTTIVYKREKELTTHRINYRQLALIYRLYTPRSRPPCDQSSRARCTVRSWRASWGACRTTEWNPPMMLALVVWGRSSALRTATRTQAWLSWAAGGGGARTVVHGLGRAPGDRGGAGLPGEAGRLAHIARCQPSYSTTAATCCSSGVISLLHCKDAEHCRGLQQGTGKAGLLSRRCALHGPVASHFCCTRPASLSQRNGWLASPRRQAPGGAKDIR